MSLKMKVKSGGGDFEQPEPGIHMAVLVAIVDLGSVEKSYKGKDYDANEIYLCWELVEQQMTGSSNNHVIGRSYTKSLGDKANLRNMISKWRGDSLKDGEEFDLSSLLGKSCLLDVQTTDDSKYCRLDALCASRLRKGMVCPNPKRKPSVWEIEGSDNLPVHLDWLPFIYGEKIVDRIERSHEWKAKRGIAGGKEKAKPHANKADEAPIEDYSDDSSSIPF